VKVNQITSAPGCAIGAPPYLLITFHPAERRSRFSRSCHMSLDWSQGSLHEGLHCFRSGAFFEAHEHWESVWLVAQEPEKTFLQSLIQVAAAFHHFQRGNCAGTVSLLGSALRRLDAYPEAFAGVLVAPFRTAIRLWLDAVQTPQRSPLPTIPQLELF
jgi:predicted metal-dependent hydrolase